MLQHGRELDEYIGRAEFDTLKEVVAENKPSRRPSIADRDTANRLRNLISQSVNNSFRPLQQKYATMVEILFSLPEGYLSRTPEKKMPAYVMLQCMGQTALALMTRIKYHPIVDEVALLVGDADLYIRIFGTNEELQNFLLVDLYEVADEVAGQPGNSDGNSPGSSIIYSTKTYTSFENTYYLRYHPAKHTEFKLSKREQGFENSESGVKSENHVSIDSGSRRRGRGRKEKKEEITA